MYGKSHRDSTTGTMEIGNRCPPGFAKKTAAYLSFGEIAEELAQPYMENGSTTTILATAIEVQETCYKLSNRPFCWVSVDLPQGKAQITSDGAQIIDHIQYVDMG